MAMSDEMTFAVLGLGKMGVDWVANLLEGGHRVVGFDTAAAARERAPVALGKGLAWIAKKRHPEEPEFAAQAAARFRLAGDEAAFLAELAHCDVLLEVILEDLGLKCEVLARTAPHLPEHSMVWTNTSSLSVRTMGVASGRPDRFIGTHGMNPVYQMPAVEVVRHADIADETVTRTVAILRGMGKEPFVASDVSGFWVNKHLVPFMLEAIARWSGARSRSRTATSASRAVSAIPRGCSSCRTSSATTPCTGWRWRCTWQPRIRVCTRPRSSPACSRTASSA